MTKLNCLNVKSYVNPYKNVVYNEGFFLKTLVTSRFNNVGIIYPILCLIIQDILYTEFFSYTWLVSLVNWLSFVLTQLKVVNHPLLDCAKMVPG